MDVLNAFNQHEILDLVIAAAERTLTANKIEQCKIQLEKVILHCESYKIPFDSKPYYYYFDWCYRVLEQTQQRRA